MTTEQDDLVAVELEDGLTVYLLPRLKWRHVSAIKWDLLVEKERLGNLPAGEIIGLLQEGYLLYGIARWDAPEPLTREAIEREILARTDRAAVLADKADELYSEQVLLPLVKLGAQSSQPMSSNGSTLPTTGSSAKRPTHSKRSSTTTTPTDAIEMTSSPPDGGSSS